MATMIIGNYRLASVETGRFALDGGAMFGVVPKALWEKKIPADERNRIGLAVRALLIEEVSGPRKILVDTGIGQKWDAKGQDIYGIDHSTLRLETSLAALGLAPDDITDVLLTHLHFDHAGGATKLAGGKVVPTFPNATYWVQRQNLAWAKNPTEKDRASYLPENWAPLEAAGILKTTDGPGEWLPGIELVLSDGHTRAMQLPHVHGAGGHLIYCADLIPTAAHIPVPWVMGYDNFPITVMEEKKRILERAVAEGWALFFEHDPLGPAARPELTSKGYQARERVRL
jgi:glyoxylase-like metal-dependent hydrolase (beta-lactamase superfamily II)